MPLIWRRHTQVSKLYEKRLPNTLLCRLFANNSVKVFPRVFLVYYEIHLDLSQCGNQ